MTAFNKFLGDTYDLVDLIKDTEKTFVAFVYDKHAKRLCAMKRRDLHSADLYKLLQDCNNPHIPQIYRMFERDGKLIIIEEHIDGQSFEELLDYQSYIFNEKFALNILLQLCDCLEPLHQANIINRDIKPSNIMLTKDNSVKIIDFGIARIFKPDSLADTEFLGTRGYAAPEQFGLFDVGQSDPRTDIHALGVTIKELLGKDYHGWLNEILERCIDLNPARRYQSIPDLVQGIKRTRKSWLVKRFIMLAAIVSALVALPQLINFETTEEHSEPLKSDSSTLTTIEPESAAESQISDNESSILGNDISNQLIDFANSQNFDISPIPSDTPNFQPQNPDPITKPTENFDDYPKLLLYINGKLSKNYSPHSTAGYIYLTETDGYKSWQRNDKGDFLFPASWSALLKIQNFTNKDVIAPHISVSFGIRRNQKSELAIDIPTVKVGQSVDVNIPLAHNTALYVLGDNNIHGQFTIKLESPSGQYPMLIRKIEIKK